MQAEQVLRKSSWKGFLVALMALIVLIGALLIISFAAAGSVKPSQPAATNATAHPLAGFSDVGPHRGNNHGALP